MGKTINSGDRSRQTQRRVAVRSGQGRNNTGSEGKDGVVGTPPPLNCWEAFRCGREPGGERSAELGVCPATTGVRYDEINRGKNGGRVCWLVEGTMCTGMVQNDYLDKFERCIQCDFYHEVHDQESRTRPIHKDRWDDR